MKQVNRDIHGGNIYKTAKEYGIRQEDILDFSANINPLGIPLSVRQQISSNIDNLINYPDPECSDLKSGISEYLGIHEENIIIGNGASEIIFLIFEVLKLKSILLPAPSFAEYKKAADSYGAKVVYYELKEENDFKLDIRDFIENMTTEIDSVFLCNPNNPTAGLMTKASLLEVIEHAKRKQVFVIIDEAFIELTEGGNLNSVADCISDYDNVFIIRAFTKLFAVPGLRLGYGIGGSEVIEKMWRRKLPWSINTFACSIGSVFREEREYLHKTEIWLREEKKWFYNELCRFEQIKAFEPHTNFVLIKLLDLSLTANLLKEKLIKKGILIRDASNFKFLNDRFVRAAIKDRKSNERFISELREVLE